MDPRIVSLKAAIDLAAEWRENAKSDRVTHRSLFASNKAWMYRDLAGELAGAIIPGATFDGVELVVPIRCAGIPRELPVDLDEFARIAATRAEMEMVSRASCNDSAILSPGAPCDGGRP